MTEHKSKTINAYLDSKYGTEGTSSRNEFHQKAKNYMVAELVKDARNNDPHTGAVGSKSKSQKTSHLKNRKSRN